MSSLNSSIGKKFVVALTGVLLLLFLIVHFIGNMMLYFGPEAFDSYVDTLEIFKPAVRVIEVLLASIFIFHIFNALRLAISNKMANPQKYAVKASSENSTVFSRTMTITGIAVFIFLVLHLSTIWAEFNFGTHGSVEYPFYAIVIEWFQNPIYAGLYVIAMFVLGYHLNHAFQSAFQTFGWNHTKYTRLIKTLGTIYSIIMAVGFASIPIYFYFMGGK